MAQMQQHGWKIIEFSNVEGWKPVKWIDWVDGLSYVRQSCPVHSNLESVSIAALIGDDVTVDVICCPACGLVSYGMLPNKTALANYYKSTWMGETLDQAITKAREVQRQANDSQPSYYGEDKTSAILEIGVGYGSQTALFQRSDYHHLAGCEACPVRAQSVREVFGIPVYDGDFLDVPEDRKYDSIFAIHVLEHLLDPMAFVSKCWRLQDPGDEVILAVPYFTYEPSWGVLAFLPHLWSFTIPAIVGLFNANGYCVEKMEQTDQLIVNARKASNSEQIAENVRNFEDFSKSHGTNDNHIERAINKLLIGLGLKQSGQYELTWQKGLEGSMLTPQIHTQIVERCDRKVIVEPLTTFRTNIPIEIVQEGPLTLFYK